MIADCGKTSRYCNLLDGALSALQFDIRFEVSVTALSASKSSKLAQETADIYLDHNIGQCAIEDVIPILDYISPSISCSDVSHVSEDVRRHATACRSAES